MKEKLVRLLLATMWVTTFVLVLLIADNLNSDKARDRNSCAPCKAKRKMVPTYSSVPTETGKRIR